MLWISIQSDAGEASFVKERVVKVFVEVVKRTWPQEWETLFSDLSGLQSQGVINISYYYRHKKDNTYYKLK